MARNYANAKDVLPLELLEAVRRYHTGLLWIPPNLAQDSRARQRKRDRLIRALRAQGLTARAIGKRMGLSERRVWQILFEHSEASID